MRKILNFNTVLSHLWNLLLRCVSIKRDLESAAPAAPGSDRDRDGDRAGHAARGLPAPSAEKQKQSLLGAALQTLAQRSSGMTPTWPLPLSQHRQQLPQCLMSHHYMCLIRKEITGGWEEQRITLIKSTISEKSCDRWIYQTATFGWETAADRGERFPPRPARPSCRAPVPSAHFSGSLQLCSNSTPGSQLPGYFPRSKSHPASDKEGAKHLKTETERGGGGGAWEEVPGTQTGVGAAPSGLLSASTPGPGWSLVCEEAETTAMLAPSPSGSGMPVVQRTLHASLCSPPEARFA